MKELKFKTNIMCGSCLSKVSPLMNQAQEITQWEVNLQGADKVLTVKTENFDAAQVVATVQKAGFTATPIV